MPCRCLCRTSSVGVLVVLSVVVWLTSGVLSAPARTVVQFAGLASSDFQDALKVVIEEFERANPDIEIDNIVVPGVLAEKLLAMLAAGTAPDVFWVSTGLFAEWGRAGFLYDMEQLARRYQTEFNLNDFWPGALETYRYSGKLYGLPREVNMAMLYYNKDLFDGAGLGYPGAQPANALEWGSTFREAARKLTRDLNGDGRSDQFGWQFRMAWWEWFPIFWSNGAELFDRGLTKSNFKSSEGAAALQYLVDLMYRYRVAPTFDDLKRLNLSNNHYQNLAAGHVAMAIDNSIPVTFLREHPNVNWDVAVIPSWAGKPRVNLASGGGFAMNAATNNPDAAFRWLAYVTGPQAARIWARTSGWVPARRSAAVSSDFLRPNVPPLSLRFVVEDAVNVRAIPSTPKWSEAVVRILLPGLNALWTNQKPAQVILEDLARQVDAVLRAN